MSVISKDAFQIVHFDSLLANATHGAGTNLLPNPGFELGSFASWTNANWSAVAAGGVTPNGIGNFIAQAGSGSYGQVSTLESSRVAIGGASDYVASLAFASPDGVGKRANNLKVLVRWWNAPSGGSKLREDTLWAAPVKQKKGGLRYVQMQLTSPAGATHASFVIQNTFAGTIAAGRGLLADEPFLAGVVTVTALSALDIWTYGGSAIHFNRLKYSWHYQSGCKRMTFRLHGPAEYLNFLINTAHGHHLETHFENERRFGGMLWSMFGRVGGRDLGVTLDSLANYIKVPYKGTYYVASNAESILRYGRKDLIADKSFDTQTAARAYADFLLNEYAFPRATGEDGGGDADNDYLDVEVMGLFGALQWVTDLPPVWLGQLDTAKAAATMTRTVLGGKSLLDRFREDTPNDFLSNDYSNVEDTGVTLPPLEDTAGKTSQEILLDLLSRGTSSKRAIVAGVGADRRFFMRQRPTTLGYTRKRDTDGKLSYYDPTGNEVPRPRVRAGEFVTEGLGMPSFNIIPGSDAVKDPANRFITEVEYDHESNELRATHLGKRKLGLDLARTVRKSRR